ncbi:MAG TPA: hypothetical protein VG675_19490 [Bryobacteraceae bacterium]|nr:hypothetical protein [Bryobacteraceae bacterium]
MKECSEWSEFTYRDSPEYQAFCLAIAEEVERQEIVRPTRNGTEPDEVRHNKLYAAWHIATKFRKHWLEPTSRSENDMLWTLYHRGWSKAQGYVAIVAWWRHHGRTITTTMMRDLEHLCDRVWNEIQEKKSAAKNEKKLNSLRNRILAILEAQPATTALLSKRTVSSSKAVDSHLYRLRKEGRVERLAWGLYGIVGRQYDKPVEPARHTSTPSSETTRMDSTRPPVVSNRTQTRPTALDDLADLDDDFDMPGLPTSYSSRELPAAMPRELPTAQPRWDRH